ncbi:DUF7127 family protein [Halorhabdus rudnickae]|uniref:DUF7127 family protein n=1 Tax=Halorhabdus rudnickae TaxID=1775544 RepID=UPI0010838F7C|nr:hypothetical protein [Halorhabdus rudnickae]
MELTEQTVGDAAIRRFDYEDATTFAADLGVDGTVDVVGDTAIVVTDDDQYDISVPDGETVTAFINNGVLTIEVKG